MNTFTQYLDALGLDKNATKCDVKAAFKRLALQCHPDKCSHQTVESSESFQKIKEAYDFLMAHDGPFDAIDATDPAINAMWNNMFDILITQATKAMKDMNKKHRKEKKETKRRNGRMSDEHLHDDSSDHNGTHRHSKFNPIPECVIDITMRVTLDELYHAKVKKLLVKVKSFPDDGSRQQEELYISLFSYKTEYIFKNKGDYLPDGKRGTIKVRLDIESHDLVRPDRILCPYDLYIDMDITLYGYYCRKYMALSYFGEVLELENMRPGMKCMVVKRKGLPYYNEKDDEDTRGDLYVYFNLKLPLFQNDEVPHDVKDVLTKHFVCT